MNAHRILSSLLCLSASVSLAGCGSTSGYPSLAKRPAERISGSALPAAPEAAPLATPAPVDASLTARLDRLNAQARTAHERFVALAPQAGQLTAAAQGAAVATEAWSVASVALAQLESRRSEVMVALADLDSLYVRGRVDGDDGVTIAAARDQIAAWVADEDATLAVLRGRMADQSAS